MLRERVITALVLVAIVLGTLAADSPFPFVVFCAVLMAAGSWEWARLNGVSQVVALVCGLVFAGFAAAAAATDWLARDWSLALVGTGVLWLVVGSLLLRAGVPGWGKVPRPLRLMGGAAALWMAWVAVSQARMVSVNFLLSVLTLVWAADIAAYFAGRAFGLRWTSTRLAPSISPGKSWEGVWGGCVGALVLACTWALLDPWAGTSSASLYARLWMLSPLALVLAVLGLAGLSVVGDLVESLVKRSAGAKDSSALLPGHGGVLDRVDALLPTLPLAVGLAALGGALR